MVDEFSKRMSCWNARTVFDVALSGSTMEQVTIARTWATRVRTAWSEHHSAVAALVAAHLKLD